MSRPRHEVAEIIRCFGSRFVERYHPNTYQLRTLDALTKCRTMALGGHKYRCDSCGREHISYNSCRNRHCPKCQAAKQAFWVEDRMENAYAVKHFHIVFTIPEALNAICLLDSAWFYNQLFATVWDTLRTFGYSHYGVESGAICVLHTWGQNLSLHPHIHCIVPAAGLTLNGTLKHIAKKGKYLYPVSMLSATFKEKFLKGLKKRLEKTHILSQYRTLLENVRHRPWVVFCEPSFGKPQHVLGYLGQYIHRVAISNHRILKVTDRDVTFMLKDYRDEGKNTVTILSGVEFLRRFCQHILPYRYVKIRYYGIYSSRFRSAMLRENPKLIIKVPEPVTARINRGMNLDVHRCPFCGKGCLVPIAVVPRVRSPSVLFYPVIKRNSL